MVRDDPAAIRRTRTLEVECERCGAQQHVERAGRYRDEDYLELWHEYADLRAAYRAAVKQLYDAQFSASILREDLDTARLLLDAFTPNYLTAPST